MAPRFLSGILGMKAPSGAPLKDRSKLYYDAIYAVDNAFDDTPDEWHKTKAEIIAKYGNYVPESCEAILASKKPCGLIQQLATQSPIIKELVERSTPPKGDLRDDTLQMFNALAFQYNRTGQQREHVMALEADGHIDADARTELARRNFQGSLIARCIMEEPNRLITDMQALLDKDAVKVGKVGHQETRRQGPFQIKVTKLEPFLDINRNIIPHDLAQFLDMETMTFMPREWADFCADLDVEQQTGHPTPNVAVAYMLKKHPGIDIHAQRDAVQALVNSGELGLDDTKAKQASPEIASALQDFDSMYSMREMGPIGINASHAAKVEARRMRDANGAGRE